MILTWHDPIHDLWMPLERQGGNEWAEANRVLGIDENRLRPGPWVSEPWQEGILDALAEPSLDWIVILKAVQMGISEVVRCAVGRWATMDPGDVLWVMATEAKARTSMKKLRAMFKNSQALRHLLSPKPGHSTLLEMILTNGMRIVIGWAGSAASLSSDPFRYVILDEAGKFPLKVGREGSPIKLGEGRTKIYGRQGKVVILSSPAHEDDVICQAYAAVLDQRRFAIPCPTCGHMQPLQFDQARWGGGGPTTAPREIRERAILAAQIQQGNSAWIECRECAGEIRSVPKAVNDSRSQWIRADLEGVASDTASDVTTRRVAFHISELYHWKTSTSDLCAKFLLVDVTELQGFWNDSLGRPYQDVAKLLQASTFRNRAIHAAGIVPAWATVVLSTADTQEDHWWYVVRAWGPGRRSRLLSFGIASSEEELDTLTLECLFPVEGSEHLVLPELRLIDSGGGMDTPDGSRTDLVYKICARSPRTLAYKGDPHKASVDGKPVWPSEVVPKGWAEPTKLILANANYWKDVLATTIQASEPTLWEECVGVDEVYCKHMTGQHKITEVSARGSKTLWRNRSKHRRKDLFDCAYMQLVAYELVQGGELTELLGAPAAAPRREEEGDDESWWNGAREGGW